MNSLVLEFLIIFFLCLFQSIFGIGLLLFGTPTFLILGYGFTSTLALLLPVSITISFLQLIYRISLKKKQIIEFNVYTIPVLFIFLIISINTSFIDIKLCVAILLIVSSLITLSKNKIIFRKKHIIKYRKYYLIFIGSIHGFTNMGGGFLSIFSSLINGDNKFLARNYIAYGYFIMGIIQYISIIFLDKSSIDFARWYYIILPIFIFFPAQKIFKIINNFMFIKVINYVAIFYGLTTLFFIFKKTY